MLGIQLLAQSGMEMPALADLGRLDPVTEAKAMVPKGRLYVTSLEN